MANPKSMNLEQLKAYRSELKSKGYELSTSKELGKVENLIKTLQPEKYGKETVSSAYKQLSSGVEYTGGWTEKNLGAIEQYTGERPKLKDPVTSEELPSYLNSYQNGVFDSANSPELRNSIVNQIEPETGRPEPINRVETYENMRENMGVADLETNLTDLKAQLEEQYAVRRQRTQSAEGKPVAMGVIAGRVSEIERQENERIDAISRQINTVTDQLNTSYNVISTYMNFMGLDYQDAVNAYNTAFNQNLQIYELVQSQIDKAQATARANLQLYTNAITSGNLTYSNLSSDQKSLINKLEVQSGLPIGFISSLKLSAKDQLIKISDDGTEAYFMDSNGKITIQATGATFNSGTTGSGASATAFRNALTQGRADLESGHDWGEVWNRIKSQFPSASNESIDAGLGGSAGGPGEADDTGWAKAGKYEEFVQKTGTTTTTSRSTEALSAMSDAVSAYQRATNNATKQAIRDAFVRDYPDYADKFATAVQ